MLSGDKNKPAGPRKPQEHLLRTINNVTFVGVKTRILYVLASDSEDFYAEQLYVSLLSLRKNSPGAAVTVLTDQITQSGLRGRGKVGERLLEAADNWVVTPLDPSFTKEYRSRLLKTGMRQYVDGDFLFIDTDTLIVRPLDGIDACAEDLALCLDHHCTLQENPEKKSHIDHGKLLGEDLSESEFYYNSGVILAKDTPQVRAVFSEWQRNYIQGRQKGIRFDQPSLAVTLKKASCPVGQLDGKWNCQLPYGVRHMGEAIIFHYFAGSFGKGSRPLFLLHNPPVLLQIRNSEDLPAEVTAVTEDFFKGISRISYLADESDMIFMTTRRYWDLRKGFVPGKFSFLEFLLKVRARLPFAGKRKAR